MFCESVAKMNFFQIYLSLSKIRIAILVLLTTFIGYISADGPYSLSVLLLLIIGVYFVSSGSFILNQAHESALDAKMNRTKNRPIPRGYISSFQASVMGAIFIFSGLFICSFVNMLIVCLSAITCILYNFFYTFKWKKRFPIASVFFGAIPGAMPVVIGYSAKAGSFLSVECGYLFLIMFLWQMPHFWSLAFRYKNDYAQAQVPVLPVYAGLDQTFFFIGLYLLAYLGLALLAPLFLKTGIVYLIIIFPVCVKIFLEYYYFYSKQKWLPFFSWLNISLLVFLGAPLFDKWAFSQFFNI